MRSAAAKVLVQRALCLCTWNLLSVVLVGQCVNVTQVPNGTISSGTSCFSNNDTVNASGVTINGSANVTFVGGRTVHLSPGFRATAGTAGTTFHAWVEAAPSAVSVFRSSGTGLSQLFTWTVSSPAGFANIADVFPLINTSDSEPSACYIYYNRASNSLSLANDAATTWMGGFSPGSSSSASNSYCTIYGIGSSVNPSGNSLSLTVNVAFQAATFSGAKNNYLNVIDNAGLYSGYQLLGTWTVANQVAPPSIAGVTPSSGMPGTQVTVTGAAFGATQGTGTIWLGTAKATVVSWGNTQIIATVGANASSGSARVQQSGAWSSAVTFTVPGPTISAVTPTIGVGGTVVTVTGSGFGATQGTGQVWLGSNAAAVQSWNANQIVAAVAAGSKSGVAQVFQNGSQSNKVDFSVNELAIASVSPTSGGAQTLVTIVGTGFGAIRGTSTVTLGSMNGLVTSWSDTQIMATVATGSVTGVVRVQQGGNFSNAVGFKVTGVQSSAVMLAPSAVKMLVGESRTLQALGSMGQTVTGLTWTSSSPSSVSLSTEDPPLLTALAAGRSTISAGGASADIVVLSGDVLPFDTPAWTTPLEVSQTIPTVPSTDGVADIFVIGGADASRTVTAITADGKIGWTSAVGNREVIADFQGGAIAWNWDNEQQSGTLFKLNGLTGAPYPS